jgi:hypothetical protein
MGERRSEISRRKGEWGAGAGALLGTYEITGLR